MGKAGTIGVIVVSAFAILEGTITLFQWVGITPDFLKPYTLLIGIGLLLTIVAIIMIGLYLSHSQKSTMQPISLNEKEKSRFSKLRFSIKKERRLDMWFLAITAIFLGPITILTITSFPEPVLPQGILEYYITKITAIIVGSFFTVFGLWIISNLILDTWEANRQLAINRQNIFKAITKDFDNAFDAVQQVSEPSTKLKMLYDFQEQLNKLCDKYEWYTVKDRIDKVFQCLIPDKLSNDPSGKRYIQILAIILYCYKANVTNTISTKWAKELEKLYNDPVYSTDDVAIILGMLQELNGYREEYLEKIVDEATTQWTQLKFNLLVHNIGFAKLRELDEEAYLRVLKYIRRKMEEATQTKREEEQKRLNLVYDLAKK